MSDECPVKDEEFYGNPKRKRDKPRRKHYCPFCGNEMHSRLIGGFVFCDKCHMKMPWTVVKTDEKPLKPL